MPKIIENLREQLLAEARLQIEERGYAETTVRSVARAVGVGVGTVYNYFESKEMLIASFVFESWKKYLERMAALPTDDARALLFGVYSALTEFADENSKLFSDASAAGMQMASFSTRHRLLREQIAGFVRPISDCRFEAEFIAESLIAHSSDRVDFDELYKVFEKIIKK
jgi:AcrR family transcriptional regulator